MMPRSDRTAFSNRIKAIILSLGLVLLTYSARNWWSIFIQHAPPCAPLCTSDFVTFYAEARLIRDDVSAMYNLDQQFAYQQQISPNPAVLPFIYPPITAAILAPIAWLNFSSAFIVITVLNVTLIGASVRRLITHLHLTADQGQWLLLFIVCNIGIHQVIYQGQTSALVLYLLTQCIVAEGEGQHYQAGLWLGLASLKPQYLPIPHLSFLTRRKWREFFVGCFLSVTLLGISFFAIGPETSRQYFALAKIMLSNNHEWWNEPTAMHNLRALTVYWLQPPWRFYLWLAGTVLVVASMAFYNLREYRNGVSFTAMWLVNILALLVSIPHLFTHDLTLLTLPCAFFLHQFKKPVPVSVGVALVAIAMLPLVNYALPTITSVTLVSLYVLSLVFLKQ